MDCADRMVARHNRIIEYQSNRIRRVFDHLLSHSFKTGTAGGHMVTRREQLQRLQRQAERAVHYAHVSSTLLSVAIQGSQR